MTAYQNVSFDDRDTDHLKYSVGWFLTGSWNASSVGETGTLSSANDLTANVTFTFPMPAVAFYYYGIPRCCGGYYAICVDCDPNNPIFTPIDAVNKSDNGQNPPVVLYSITFDQPGVHEIILTNQNDTRFGKSQITIDRFDLQVVNNNVTSDVTPVTVFQSPASTSTAETAVNSTSTTPIGAIIGGVIGGIILIAVLIFLFIFVVRRRSRRVPWQEPYSSPSQFTDAPNVPSYYMGSGRSEPSMRQSMLTANTHSTGNLAPSRLHGQWASTTSASGSGRFNPVRETDAGRVMSSSYDGHDPTLPPEYEQVFSGSSRATYSDMASSSGQSSASKQYPRRKS